MKDLEHGPNFNSLYPIIFQNACPYQLGTSNQLIFSSGDPYLGMAQAGSVKESTGSEIDKVKLEFEELFLIWDLTKF